MVSYDLRRYVSRPFLNRLHVNQVELCAGNP